MTPTRPGTRPNRWEAGVREATAADERPNGHRAPRREEARMDADRDLTTMTAAEIDRLASQAWRRARALARAGKRADADAAHQEVYALVAASTAAHKREAKARADARRHAEEREAS
jgi:hypothetical protein